MMMMTLFIVNMILHGSTTTVLGELEAAAFKYKNRRPLVSKLTSLQSIIK